MLSGARLSFDEESKALYDAVAPEHPDSYFQGILRELDALLPQSGSLIERYDRFRQDFVIPGDRLARVFARAIEECRRRTLEHPPPSARPTSNMSPNREGYNW